MLLTQHRGSLEKDWYTLMAITASENTEEIVSEL
jgi:hypothetical protein